MNFATFMIKLTQTKHATQYEKMLHHQKHNIW